MKTTISFPNSDESQGRPEFFPLPKPGKRDPYFGMSRSWYYAMEKQGRLKLVRIRQRGKIRGITRVPYDAVKRLLDGESDATA